MKSKVQILIYTHSEYAFIWKAFVGQMEKYVDKNIEIHFGYDENANPDLLKEIPENWIKHTYPEHLVWTSRVKKMLQEMDCEHVLFLHEDWLPTGDVKQEVLDYIADFMTHQNCGFLVSYSHISVTSIQPGIDTIYPEYKFFKEDAHIFQPGIWNKKVFEEFCNLNKSKHQNEDFDCLNFMRGKNTYSVQNYNTVTTLRTTNSLLFPHMHALSQGLWNFTKYPTLEPLLQSYGVNTKDRGIHTWWELDTQ